MARPRTGQARPLEDALLSPRTLLLANDNDPASTASLRASGKSTCPATS
ncbi:hypothetical protein MGWOODY_Smn2013 [hydrothermal vent metagenome]|uniref:Uncharacterized protein n=1 Tax=hydrothermal vent metagenome TaxID=652676 RepID=A0A161K0T6_9ZZZZ